MGTQAHKKKKKRKTKQSKYNIRMMIIFATAACILTAAAILLIVILGGRKDKDLSVAETVLLSSVADHFSEDDPLSSEDDNGKKSSGDVIDISAFSFDNTADSTEDLNTSEEETEKETKPYKAKLNSLTAPAEQNPSLSGGLEFVITGDEAYAYVPYVMDDALLSDLKLEADIAGGSASFSGAGAKADGKIDLAAGAILTVTDDGGATRNYKVYCKYGHDLPVVYINTEKGKAITSKWNYINATFSMKANGVEGFDDVPLRGIRIRGRGNSTWLRYFPKKAFKMNFNEKISLMGAANDKDWLLIANFYDRSLSRNHLALQLSRQLSALEFTMDSHPVDVILNGEYYGMYDLAEQPEVAKGRIAIKTDPAAEDSGFYLEVGGAGFSVGSLEAVEIHYPKEYNAAQKKYIANYIAQIDKIITSGADLDALSQYVDIDNLVDWLLLQEYTYNFDAGFSRNTYMYKEPGGKLKFGPAWDFDLAMGSVFYNTLEYQNWATSCNGLNGVTWSTYLYDNPEFIEKMKNRWLQVRESLQQTTASVLAELLAIGNASYEENYDRWMKEYEGENLLWECELEYKLRTMAQMQGYVKKILDYRYTFLNRALLEGYKPKKEPKIDSTETQTETEKDTAGDESGEDDETTALEDASQDAETDLPAEESATPEESKEE